MSLIGLLLPMEGEPQALRHAVWDTSAITSTLDSGHMRGTLLDWSPSPAHMLLLLAATDADGPANPRAVALGGVQAHPFRGDVLILGVTAERQIVSLGKKTLMLICTRLLVAEVAAGELPA